MEAILAILFITIFVFVVSGVLRRNFHSENDDSELVDTPHYATIHSILNEKFDYYKALSIPGKKVFADRVQNFIDCKDFVAMADLELTDEVMILISASAIQLTFGLDDYLINSIDAVHVYPRPFHFGYDQVHKGNFDTAGILSISWEDFLKGYSDPNDKINLGLHEMTHALHFSIVEGELTGPFNDYYDSWEEIASNIAEEMPTEENPILRGYAIQNPMEFLSVCVEYFFEQPENLKNLLPDVFSHLCMMLNQNPLNKTTDYKFNVNEFTEETKSIFSSNRPNHWSISVAVFSIVFGPLIFFITLFKVLEPTFNHVLMIVLFSIISGSIQYRTLRKNFWFNNLIFGIYSVLSGFLLYGFFLILNNFGPSITKSEVTFHEIKGVNRSNDETSVWIAIEPLPFKDFKQIKQFNRQKLSSISTNSGQKRIDFEGRIDLYNTNIVMIKSTKGMLFMRRIESSILISDTDINIYGQSFDNTPNPEN